MPNVEKKISDPEVADMIFDMSGDISSGPVRSSDIVLRMSKCPVHGEGFEPQFGITHSPDRESEGGKLDVALIGCCEEFLEDVVRRLKKSREPEPREANIIEVSCDVAGMRKFRFTHPALMRALMRSLGDLWETKIQTLRCAEHQKGPSHDYKQIFTKATEHEPMWGAIIACCPEFSTVCLRKLVDVTNEDLDDSILDSSLIH